MSPDLVLDNDAKKRRFKRLKNIGRKKSGKSEVTSNHYKSNTKKKLLFGNTGQFQIDPPKPTKPDMEDKDMEEEDTESLLEFVKDTAVVTDVERIYQELASNKSSLDPETGLLLSCQVPTITATSSHTVTSYPEDPLAEVEVEDKTILKYIHKKFRPMQPPPSGGGRRDISASAMIRSVSIRTIHAMEASLEDILEDSLEDRAQVQQRRSVIVRRQEQEQEHPLNTTIDIEFEARQHGTQHNNFPGLEREALGIFPICV